MTQQEEVLSLPLSGSEFWGPFTLSILHYKVYAFSNFFGLIGQEIYLIIVFLGWRDGKKTGVYTLHTDVLD